MQNFNVWTFSIFILQFELNENDSYIRPRNVHCTEW